MIDQDIFVGIDIGSPWLTKRLEIGQPVALRFLLSRDTLELPGVKSQFGSG